MHDKDAQGEGFLTLCGHSIFVKTNVCSNPAFC